MRKERSRQPDCNRSPAAGNRISGGLSGAAIARICQLALVFFLLHVLQIAFLAYTPHAAHLLPSMADGAQAQSADVSGTGQPLANAAPVDANRADEPAEPATGASAAGAAAAVESRPQALFNRGNYMMEQQDYAEAVAIFQQIEQNGHASGPLFYNMGISYLYLDSLGQASYYFHKSKAFRESAARAKEGISTVERLMRIRGTFIPQLPWYAFFDWFLFHMNHAAWIVWGLVFINMGVLVILAGWLYRPDRRIAITGMALSAMGIVQVVVTISISVWANGYQQGVVVENGIPVTPSPDMMVDEDFSPDLAYEAYTVTLDKRLSRQHDGWVHIRLRNGVSGWIPEPAVQKL